LIQFNKNNIASTQNPHWARVVDYGAFSLCKIHKEGLCRSSGNINGLMMMMMNIASYNGHHQIIITREMSVLNLAIIGCSR
jgi:hypothetical protein